MATLPTYYFFETPKKWLLVFSDYWYLQLAELQIINQYNGDGI